MLSLRGAASEFGVNRKTLKSACDAGTITCERDHRGMPRFDRATLARELEALPACGATGCGNAALGPSGYCATHAIVAARAASLRAATEPVSERDYLTFDECLALAGVEWLTLDRAVRRGELVDERVGHCRTIKKTDIRSWIARRDNAASGYLAWCTESSVDPVAGTSKAAYAAKVASDAGLLTTDELCRELGVRSESSATRRVRVGDLPAIRLTVHGATFFHYRPEDVRAFKRKHWERAKTDGRRQAWLDESRVVSLEGKRVERLERMLGSRAAAEAAVRAEASERRRAYSGAARRGRTAAAHNSEWLGLFLAIRDELVSYADEHGESAPSNMKIAEAAAHLDWQSHPERWPRDKWPAARGDRESLDPNLEQGAGKRLWRAVADEAKALQIALTETRAA